MTTVTIEKVRARAEADAKTYGYYLTPDPDLLQGLLEGLKVNEERYGYPSCPCRLASGRLQIDRDIICPCDYRDPDVAEFGACYCRLYVNKSVYEKKTELPTVPERRPMEKQSR
ncbi:MAG TPA: ferredoxin-thioredoxin reductase catalytic domain-containing protein, partial [Candidatus Bathyarchaeia archaeon]